MPCHCEKCFQNTATLGLLVKAPSKAAIHKAFRSAAKQWHPDRYENEPGKRLEAEEHFKHIQVAFRELLEHCEAPEKVFVEVQAPSGFDRAQNDAEPPSLFFGNAPGCFVAPRFPWSVWNVIAHYLQENERALAFIDLSASVNWAGNRSQFILLTSYRIFVRDALNVISLLWYADLGEILFVSRQKQRKPGIWQRFVRSVWNTQVRYSLVIKRHNGTHFFSVDERADDRVKRVIYNFLLQMKQQQPH
jgi:hypothetical protein